MIVETESVRPSLRAKRSKPGSWGDVWIASSLAPLAKTDGLVS